MPGHINTPGVVPVVFQSQLFIVSGGIRGSLLPTVYGSPYTYENFPWKEHNMPKIPSRDDCIKVGMNNFGDKYVNEKIQKMIDLGEVS